MARIIRKMERNNNRYKNLENILFQNLSDEYIIITDVWLGVDYLNFLILNKNKGVFILKIHELNINDVEVNPTGSWLIKSEITVASPVEQVLNYKENIIHFHIPEICIQLSEDFRIGKFIKPWIILNANTREEIDKFYKRHLEKKEHFLKSESLEIWGNDEYNTIVEKIIDKTELKNLHFPNGLFEKILERVSINNSETFFSEKEVFNIQQLRLSKSKTGAYYINGVVGSGKTSIIARRAVNAFLRTRKQVLVLTMNITLINLIRLKVQELSPYSLGYIKIINYHKLISDFCNNILFNSVKAEDGTFDYNALIKHLENNYPLLGYNYKEAFSVLLIDELQDFQGKWLETIAATYYSNCDEIVCCIDNLQTIYEKPHSEKLFTEPKHDIVTLKEIFKKDFQLNLLKRSYRNEVKIQKKIEQLQESLFPNRIRDEIMLYSHKINRKSSLNYTLYTESEITMIPKIAELINSKNYDNLTILCMRLRTIRILDAYIRYYYGSSNINSVCETQEIYFEYYILYSEYGILKFNSDIDHYKLNSCHKYRNNKYIPPIYIRETVKYLTLITLQKLYEKEKFVSELEKINKDNIIFDLDILDTFSSDYVSILKGNKKDLTIRNNLAEIKIRLYRQALRKLFVPLQNYNNISTIHSYKGFENKKVILLLENKFIEGTFVKQFEEIIYTALTRTVNTLEVYNCGNLEYHTRLSKIIK